VADAVDERPLDEVVADTCERAEQAPDAGMVAEATVDGAPPAARRPCPHERLTFQNVAGTVDDEFGTITRWVLRVRVRCANCGVPFDAVPGSARDPQDHPIGVVFDLLPVEDRELAASVPPHGDGD
jgi:hypothetical protein